MLTNDNHKNQRVENRERVKNNVSVMSEDKHAFFFPAWDQIKLSIKIEKQSDWKNHARPKSINWTTSSPIL